MILTLVGGALAQEPTQEERIAALKQSMAASMEALKGYEWTETTVVNYKGEDKSHTQAKCSYGADGKVVKEPMGEPAEEPKKKRGLRGHKAEKTTGELKEYMGSAAALIETYVPPSPELIQKCQDAGKVSVEVVEANKKIILRLKDYQLAGDSVGVEVDLTTNTLIGYEVATYLDSPDQAVTLNVTFEKLEDGTIYAGLSELDAKAKGMKVDISNTDYRHAGK